MGVPAAAGFFVAAKSVEEARPKPINTFAAADEVGETKAGTVPAEFPAPINAAETAEVAVNTAGDNEGLVFSATTESGEAFLTVAAEAAAVSVAGLTTIAAAAVEANAAVDPTVRFEPFGKALAVATKRVPDETIVPPV
jgi:hypothetical protein